MRWEDERYVKLYTRDTLTTKRLGWEGRAVLWELFRKVDRAGIAEIGDEEVVQALSGLTGIPPRICDVAWSRLSAGKSPVVTLRDGKSRAFFIMNYLPAQEAKQSDRARQEKHRELARSRELASAAARDVLSQGVGARDEQSQNVTESHDRSHDVTPSLAVLSRTETKDDHRSKGGESEGRNTTACESVDNPEPIPANLSESERSHVLTLFRDGKATEARDYLASLQGGRGIPIQKKSGSGGVS